MNFGYGIINRQTVTFSWGTVQKLLQQRATVMSTIINLLRNACNLLQSADFVLSVLYVQEDVFAI